jgi:DMSO/TMAO reductase YedYZ molybdopterin-dependent catalytic subunit
MRVISYYIVRTFWRRVQIPTTYDLNAKRLPVANGAPLRLRVERQLGYKHAKYVMRIQAVQELKSIGGGKGGFCEDRGYEWYTGV